MRHITTTSLFLGTSLLGVYLTLPTGFAQQRPVCGNSAVEQGEGCDDGNRTSRDGCSASCKVETGWGCLGSPSSCQKLCGNGRIDARETCDDSNAIAGDGCNKSCKVESGWTCTGEPSQCERRPGGGGGGTGGGSTSMCGNWALDRGESCDDGNRLNGDGCSTSCKIESGGSCIMYTEKMYCTLCGDGYLFPTETCDDGNKVNGDGCSNRCRYEKGFSCLDYSSPFDRSGPPVPSICTATCGNGVLDEIGSGGMYAPEECDDGVNHRGITSDNDGCSRDCKVEEGYACTFQMGQRSVCGAVPMCGDGALNTQSLRGPYGMTIAAEECDDGNWDDSDGCSSCRIDQGWNCTGESCEEVVCGDLYVTPMFEGCDDGNTRNWDGCSSSCSIEPGRWSCPRNPANGYGGPCRRY